MHRPLYVLMPRHCTRLTTQHESSYAWLRYAQLMQGTSAKACSHAVRAQHDGGAAAGSHSGAMHECALANTDHMSGWDLQSLA